MIAKGRRIGDDWRGGAAKRGELRFQRSDLGRQLDGAKQLGPLADNAAQLPLSSGSSHYKRCLHLRIF